MIVFDKSYIKTNKQKCQETYKQSSGVGMHPRWSPFQSQGTGKFKTCLMEIHQNSMIFNIFWQKIWPFFDGVQESWQGFVLPVPVILERVVVTETQKSKTTLRCNAILLRKSSEVLNI